MLFFCTEKVSRFLKKLGIPLGVGMFLIGLVLMAAAVLRLGDVEVTAPGQYHIPRWEYVKGQKDYSTGHGYYQRRAERHGTLYQRTGGPH